MAAKERIMGTSSTDATDIATEFAASADIVPTKVYAVRGRTEEGFYLSKAQTLPTVNQR